MNTNQELQNMSQSPRDSAFQVPSRLQTDTLGVELTFELRLLYTESMSTHCFDARHPAFR